MIRDRPTDIRLSNKKNRRSPQAVPLARAQSPLLIPLTQRALYQRLSRALARDGKRLKKTRAAPARSRLGDFFIVNDNGGIVAHHVDLRQLARELDVLRPYETTEN